MFSSGTWVAGPINFSHRPRRITYKVWLDLASLRKMLTGTYGSDVYLRHFQKILQTLYNLTNYKGKQVVNIFCVETF
jgi:hypothetical protein